MHFSCQKTAWVWTAWVPNEFISRSWVKHIGVTKPLFASYNTRTALGKDHFYTFSQFCGKQMQQKKTSKTYLDLKDQAPSKSKWKDFFTKLLYLACLSMAAKEKCTGRHKKVLYNLHYFEVPLHSQNTLLGFIPEWEALLCPAQNYACLNIITRAILVGNSLRMATIPVWICHRHTETQGITVCSSERGGETGFAPCFLSTLAL